MRIDWTQLAARIAARSPLIVEDTPFEVRLLDYHAVDDPIHLSIAAEAGDEHYRGELHVTLETADRADFVDVVLGTMERIIRGDLPPGARNLL